jgi:hypothetical protein
MSEHNVAGELMKLAQADLDHMNDFNEVVEHLKKNTFEIVNYVHNMDRLMIDDGHTLLNCPPGAEEGDDHGGLLIRTYSEQVDKFNVEAHPLLSREFKVHDLGTTNEGSNKVEIRCDVTRNGVAVLGDESKVVVEI